MRILLKRFLRDEAGSNLIEYVLLASTVAIGGYAAVLEQYPGAIDMMNERWTVAKEFVRETTWQPVDRVHEFTAVFDRTPL